MSVTFRYGELGIPQPHLQESHHSMAQKRQESWTWWALCLNVCIVPLATQTVYLWSYLMSSVSFIPFSASHEPFCSFKVCWYDICSRIVYSSVLAWRLPGTGEPGRLPSLGSHRVGHDWSDLAAAAAAAAAAWKEGKSFGTPGGHTSVTKCILVTIHQCLRVERPKQPPMQCI